MYLTGVCIWGVQEAGTPLGRGSALCLPSKAAFLSYREGLEDDTQELLLVNSADGCLLRGRYLTCELRALQFLE